MIETFLELMLFLTPTLVLGSYVIYSRESLRNANALRTENEKQQQIIQSKDEEIRNLENRLHWLKETRTA